MGVNLEPGTRLFWEQQNTEIEVVSHTGNILRYKYVIDGVLEDNTHDWFVPPLADLNSRIVKKKNLEWE
jgi:hypothetical protein